MEPSSPSIDEIPAARTPLKIIVSEAGQRAALKALAAQCIPILQNPDAFTKQRRQELALRLTRAVGIVDPSCTQTTGEEPECEAGSWLEEEA